MKPTKFKEEVEGTQASFYLIFCVTHVSEHVSAVPGEARRGRQIPLEQVLAAVVSCHVCAGN